MSEKSNMSPASIQKDPACQPNLGFDGQLTFHGIPTLLLLSRPVWKALRIGPELADGLFEIAAHCGHHITGNVCRTAFDLPQVVAAVAEFRSEINLREFSRYAHLRNGTSKNLTWRLRSASLVCSDWLTHLVMVAQGGRFVITTIVMYIPERQL